MLEGADKQFADLALREKLLTPQQLDECVAAQALLARAGFKWPLAQVVREKGVLPRKDIRRILELMQADVRSARLPGYELLEELGRGAVGIVFKARQINVNRIVAIKILSRVATADTRFVELFQREARAVASLRHQNIVAAFDFGEADGWHYMVMEMVEGLTLRKLVGRTGALLEEQALRIATEIAEALRHAHARGIIHRDVKPGNIMLDTSGLAKLCDLGMAKVTDLGDPTFARPGQVLGTPYYMAPEQVRADAEVDHRADIYSLGVTLFYMLTGDVPFKDPSPAVVMAKQVTEEIPWARDLNPKVSDAASRVVAKMMAKNPADRYQTCDQLIFDLKAVMNRGLLIAPVREKSPGVKPPVVKEPAPTPAKKEVPAKKERPYTNVILAGAAILLLLLTGYYWWASRSAARETERTLQMAFEQAVRTAKMYPQDRKENYRRFQQLKEAARGTPLEAQIDEEIKRLVPRPISIETE